MAKLTSIPVKSGPNHMSLGPVTVDWDPDHGLWNVDIAVDEDHLIKCNSNGPLFELHKRIPNMPDEKGTNYLTLLSVNSLMFWRSRE
jgi:hypothetical protein